MNEWRKRKAREKRKKERESWRIKAKKTYRWWLFGACSYRVWRTCRSCERAPPRGRRMPGSRRRTSLVVLLPTKPN
ncbi:hypothetical protein PUN28_015934 [Cardiocondyla obscurior]|uniref:Uncharacterized protein n=1 Tax=Cardiocondyla obscurior TaxID=286306 RepID=A0AAW2ETZ4_9HYME